MSAKNNDPDRIEEIYSLIQTLKERLNLFEITEEKLLNPQDELAQVINENTHSLLYRITEQAHSLSFSVQSKHANIEWDSIRDFRNLLAHDYTKVNNTIIWDSIVDDIPASEQVCIDYANEYLITLPPAYARNGKV